MVDCGGLENRCPGDWTGGSNPSFSAEAITSVAQQSCATFCFMKSPSQTCLSEGSEIKQKFRLGRNNVIALKHLPIGITSEASNPDK